MGDIGVRYHKTGARKRRQSGFTLVEIMVVVLIIATLVNMAAPAMIQARNNAWTKSCIKNLSTIYAAKQQWALDNHQAGSALPTWVNLQPYVETQYGTVGPVCPASGAVYTLGQVDEYPTCPSYPLTHAMH